MKSGLYLELMLSIAEVSVYVEFEVELEVEIPVEFGVNV